MPPKGVGNDSLQGVTDTRCSRDSRGHYECTYRERAKGLTSRSLGHVRDVFGGRALSIVALHVDSGAAALLDEFVPHQSRGTGMSACLNFILLAVGTVVLRIDSRDFSGGVQLPALSCSPLLRYSSQIRSRRRTPVCGRGSSSAASGSHNQVSPRTGAIDSS